MPRPKKANRGDGRYELKRVIGRDGDGNTLRKSFYGKSEAEALLQFSLHCLESAENAGYISSNDAKEARNALFQSIREAG